MDSNLTSLAFVAGMVAAVNPCGFAMLPAYLTLVVNRGEGGRPLTAVARALAATAVMALGFVTVFGLFGLLTVSVAATAQRFLPYVTVLVGVALVAAGIWLLSGRELPAPAWNPMAGSGRWAPSARLGSMYGYGVGYAIASLSCTVGPFLAVTGSSLRSGRPLDGVLVYLAYAAGIALVVGVLAVAVALASTAAVRRLRAVLPHVNRVSGVIMVVVGLYVGYYGLFELRLMGAQGAVDDPVIAAAGRLQRLLAGWVYRLGGWPWLLALAALTALAAATVVTRRRRRGPAAGQRR